MSELKPEHANLLAQIDGLMALHPDVNHDVAMAVLARAAARFGLIPVGWLDTDFALIRIAAPQADPSTIRVAPETSYKVATTILAASGDMLDDGSWESISAFLDANCKDNLLLIARESGLLPEPVTGATTGVKK